MSILSKLSLDSVSVDSVRLSTIARFVSDHKREVLCGTAAVIGAYFAWQKWNLRNMPPGPKGRPIVGCAEIFNEGFVNALEKLRKDYGGISTLWLGGSNYIVVLSDYKIVKELYVDRFDEFCDRKEGAFSQVTGFGDMFSNRPFDDSCRKERKFCVQALNTAGYAKSKLAVSLEEEWRDIANILDEQCNVPFDVKQTFLRGITNMIMSVIFNKRFLHSDEELDRYANNVNEWNSTIAFTNIDVFSLFPQWVLKLFFPKVLTDINNCKRVTANIIGENDKYIQEHIQHFDPNDIKDFVDICLQKGIHKDRGISSISYLCLGFMSDAIHTTTSVLMHSFMYLVHYPEWQHKIREEAKQAVGESAHVVPLDKRDSCPITEAFINEVFRVVTPAGIGAPNMAVRTTNLAGYRIPKGTSFWLNIVGMHYNPKYFPNPEKFQPERFLENGKLKRIEYFMPFGKGSRQCLGQQLARSDLFFFIINTVARFKLGASGELPDVEPVESLIREAKPFDLVMKPL